MFYERKVSVMNKAIEKFKKEMRSRIIMCFGLCAAIIAAYIIKVFVLKTAFSDIPDFKKGFITGFAGVIALSLFLLGVYTLLTLRDEKKLIAAYNAEHDERLAAIKAKSGQPIIIYTSELMILAGIIINDLNVSQALFAAAFIQLVISCIVKVVYSKIM